MIIAQKDDPSLSHVIKFASPVPLSKTRWARKLLQMGSGPTALIADYRSIYGFGSVSDISGPALRVDFLDQQQWDFRRGNQVLLRTRFGEPRLPEEAIGEARFMDNFRRLFPEAGEQSAARFHKVLEILLQQPRGSMLVVAEDAASEAARLEHQGTRIEPAVLSRPLLEQACRIDGTIIADPKGLCYAIGVILDGAANYECSPARGARYNSAVRYVDASQAKRLAFVISEDRTLDIIPLLRPRVSARHLSVMVDSLEKATTDNFHVHRSALDEHRFYLNADQCRRVNSALERLNKLVVEEGAIVWMSPEFVPDPGMNDAFLAP